MSTYLLTRRELVIGGLTLSAGAVTLGLTGCAQVAEVVVPIIAGEVLHDLYLFAKDHFAKSFEKGQALYSPLSEDVPVMKGLDPTIHEGFKNASVENTFCTPIVMHQRGGNRLLQLAQENALWSLITGGISGERVFQIHRDWLEWLLYEDNCNLRVNGNSTFEACGVEGCHALVNRQKFLDVNGTEKIIQFTPQAGNSKDVLEQHSKHSFKWIGCPSVKASPEECTL